MFSHHSQSQNQRFVAFLHQKFVGQCEGRLGGPGAHRNARSRTQRGSQPAGGDGRTGAQREPGCPARVCGRLFGDNTRAAAAAPEG